MTSEKEPEFLYLDSKSKARAICPHITLTSDLGKKESYYSHEYATDFKIGCMICQKEFLFWTGSG